jgi:NADH-quinone oxidoreductase subunit M
MGTYGFLRLALPILPKGALAFGPVVATLAVANAIYGDLVASAQRDLKRMAAYSSISHMGFATLGVMSFSVNGIRGASLHMFNHGIIMGMFFLCVGLINRHLGTREIGGIRAMLATVPVLGALFWFASLASFGMPGTSGFVGELWIFLGAYETRAVLAVVALLGAIIMAGYIFWMLSRISFGSKPAESTALDIQWAERFSLIVLAATILVLGFYPLLALSRIGPSVPHIVNRVGLVK